PAGRHHHSLQTGFRRTHITTRSPTLTKDPYHRTVKPPQIRTHTHTHTHRHTHTHTHHTHARTHTHTHSHTHTHTLTHSNPPSYQSLPSRLTVTPEGLAQ